MTDEDRKEYARLGALALLLGKCAKLIKDTVTRSMVESLIAVAQDYLELCDEEEANT